MPLPRAELEEIAERYLEWSNAPVLDPHALSTIVAREVIVPTPYPRSTTDFDWIIKLMQDTRTAAPDIRITSIKRVIDESADAVVNLNRLTGTHNGYLFSLQSLKR